MKTVRLKEDKIYCGNLLLVNAHYPLRDTDVRGLVPADPRFSDVRLKRDAVNILQLILERISAAGDIVPVSGYRSCEEQTAIYRNSIRENGERFTQKYVALPNHSEHQTGLAIDLALNQKDIDFIRPDFPYDGVCEKFRQSAPDYGFIQRYPKGKEKITGIAHEPWHFRYVGYPHSKIMAQHCFSLEEYTEFMKAYSENSRLHYQPPRGAETELWYVPAAEHETQINIPKASICQISGNNTDGFIVTVWKSA